jgi:membrane protein involved in D-alanine export
MCIAVMIGIKFVLKGKLSYKYVLAFLSLVYIGLLFNKPLHLIGLVLYLYIASITLRKFYKKDNLVLPMLILSVPIFLMKSLSIIPADKDSTLLLKAKDIVQIAGLSYMVFKVISLYIDERRNKGIISFIDFFNFTAFVPTLLIGPLDRFKRFNADVKRGYDGITEKMISKGWNNLILGLLYKFIIAEAIRRYILVNLVDDTTLIYHFSYMYTYLLYLFFDFAGYSLLAMSFGNFMGIDVPYNFDKPFLSVNPKEFWKKWHKTLGDWLNDYFFKPIFKYLTTKKYKTSITRQNIALMLTFTLMGFWNGFQLHYVVSGMLFGLYSVIHNYYVYKCKRTKKDVVFGNLNPKWVRIISIVIMFNAVAFAIYIFSGKLF